MRIEGPERSFFSRRTIAHGVLAAVGIAGAVGGGIGVNKGIEAMRFRAAQGLTSISRPCYGKDIPYLPENSYIASPFYHNFASPVRSEPSTGKENIVAWVPAGEHLRAKGVYGDPFEGGSLSSYGLGRVKCIIKGPDGQYIDSKHDYGTYYLPKKMEAMRAENGDQSSLKPLFNGLGQRDFFIGALNLRLENPNSGYPVPVAELAVLESQ